MLAAGSQADFHVLCYQFGGEVVIACRSRWRQKAKGVWRCLTVEKLSQVELRTDACRTPGHTLQKGRPALMKSISDADVQPGDNPQVKGSEGSCLSKRRAKAMRSVAIE